MKMLFYLASIPFQQIQNVSMHAIRIVFAVFLIMTPSHIDAVYSKAIFKQLALLLIPTLQPH
jgi:hypothetical protein